MSRVVCVQLAPRIADPAANRRASRAAIRRAAGAGADVIVLPELVTSGYLLADGAEARSVAVGRDDALFGEWAADAGGATVIGGFCELGDDGLLYNSAAVVDGSGVHAVYRKTHLWDREKRLFRPGAQPPPLVDTAAGRIGVLLCYDLEFPEMTRDLALRGAELVAVPVNWPLLERPAGEHPPEIVIAMAMARINRVFIAVCDRAGAERGQEWTAGTAIVDEYGWPVATAGTNGEASADIRLPRARDKTAGTEGDLFADRRPELYGSVMARQCGVPGMP